MAALAAAAIAVAALCAAAVQGGTGVGGLDVPVPVLAAALAAVVAGAAARRSTRVLPPGNDVVVLTAVSVAGFVGLYLAGWTDRTHVDDVARLLPLAVAALGVLWPEPNVLRYTLLLAGASLLGAAGQPVRSRWPVGAAVIALALGLVATNRLTAASGPPLGGPAPAAARRRVAGEAAALLVVVGLLAALAAALVPPPPGQGGGGEGNSRAAPRRGQPAPPPVDFGDRLDVGAGRDERGHELLLRVRAPGPELWRARTYDRWDGESWSRSPALARSTRTVVNGRVEPGIGDPDNGADGSHFVHSVTVEARAALVLVAAARPVDVHLPRGAAVQSADASLAPPSPLFRGESYLVDSRRSHAEAHGLRALGRIAVPTDVADAYLQLPQLSPRVRALAAGIGSGAPTTYDIARAVGDWLLEHTTVTDDAEPVPEGADPLEAFLLDDQAGPPERSATAMAVMLRALGVPTRMAVGFLPGQRSGPGGDFLVRASDTHAWVEVWFPQLGWQRFDPTGKAPSPEPERESVWDRLWRFLRRLLPLVLLVALAAATWLAWRGVRAWRRRRALPWAARFFARLERAGAARGRPRRPPETPAEYAGELSRSVLPDPRLVEVGELVTAGAFSRQEPPAEARARAEEVLRQATRAAPVRPLRRFNRSRPGPRPTIRRP